jgi:hypothetical protein
MNRSAAEYAHALGIVHEVMVARTKGFTWRAALGYLRNEIQGVPERPAYDREARDRILRLCDAALSRERDPGVDPLELVRVTLERWLEEEFQPFSASH